MKRIEQLVNEYPYPLVRAQIDAAELGITPEEFLRLRDREIREAVAEGVFQ
jgi:hypothetical protein